MSESDSFDHHGLHAQITELAGKLAADEVDTEPAVLLENEHFVEGVELLAAPAVPYRVITAIIGRYKNVYARLIAVEALAIRGESDEAWRRWALRRMKTDGYYSDESLFLLRAFTRLRHGLPLARVLAAVHEDWDDDMYGAVADFVLSRLAAGEQVDRAALAEHLRPEHEPAVEAVLGTFVNEPPEPFAAAVAEWRASLVDLDFLRQFARVHEAPLAAAELLGERPRIVDALVAAITERRSTVLVGEHGVGKSALVREALRRLGSSGWVLFEAGAAETHGGNEYSGELETRVRDVARRTEGRPLVWLFPRLEEAAWAGVTRQDRQGVLDALLPYVEDGRIVLVGEVAPTALDVLLKERPRVASVFDTVRVPPLEAEHALEVAQAALAAAGGVEASDATLREALELASHYVPNIAAPGNLVRLAKAARALVVERGGSELEVPDVIDALSAGTGLPLELLDARRPLDLHGLRDFFAERVLGQPGAVDCLVERVAMVKAGLTDDTRPLGVFLFVGPTGTGKTEIAKALAEYLFGSPDRMVRLDMSEYATFDSFERLLADSSSDRYGATLASSVRAQPFSVVLLDEFEKAHRRVHDLFLQVFDDARLTDSSGRTVDFRHCVVILTSNVGSAIPRDAGIGFAGERAAFDARAVEREVRDWFRPELVNRLDRVVVFRPFDRDVMRALLELELRRVLRRRGLRTQPWAVEWDAGAIEFLLEQGFSPELGARPLRRAVEQHLLAPLSLAMVERRVPEGEQFLFVSAAGGKRLDVAFIDPDGDTGTGAVEPPPELTVAALALDGTGGEAEVALLRRETERVLEAVAADVAGRKHEELEATHAEGFWELPERAVVLARIEYLDRIEAASETAAGLLARLEGGSSARRDAQLVRLLASRVHVLDRALAGLCSGEPADAVVAIRVPAAESRPAATAFAADLLAMYEGWASRRGMRATPRRVGAPDGAASGLAVAGLGAFTILAPEDGLHVLEVPAGEHGADRITVHVEVTPLEAGSPARGVSAPRVVRRYRRDPSPLVRDAVRGWRTGRLDRVLAGDFDLF